VTGLRVDELLARVRDDVAVNVQAVLDEEVVSGRVVRDRQGRYAIRVERFTPAVLRALAALDDDDENGGWSRRPLTLAERIAVEIATNGPAAGSTIATALGVRKDDVLRELRDNSAFDRVGGGHTARWQLADREPFGTEPEPFGRNETAAGSSTTDSALAARLRRLEERVALLEAGRERA
jgi:hypothetical protein